VSASAAEEQTPAASLSVTTETGTATNVTDPAAECTPASGDSFSYPCVADTTAGASDRWLLRFTNGSEPAIALTAINVLPTPGDTGVVSLEERGSEFTPSFTGDLELLDDDSAGAALEWYVTTLQEPCTGDMNPQGAPCAPGAWIPSGELGSTVDAAEVTGLKLVFDFAALPDGALAPGASVAAAYTTLNDDEAALTGDADAVAWNSFAYAPTPPQAPAPLPVEAVAAGVVVGPGGPTAAPSAAASGSDSTASASGGMEDAGSSHATTDVTQWLTSAGSRPVTSWVVAGTVLILGLAAAAALALLRGGRRA
jgi:hypothetical protein